MSIPLPTEQESQSEKVRKARICDDCGAEKEWRDCYNCGGEGFSYHDCGEDCCCCLDPEDNVTCDICEGAGGWLQCRMCYEGSDWDD